MKGNYGPQPTSDNAFTGRMRFHQSWYRATVLGVGYGTGPVHERGQTSTTDIFAGIPPMLVFLFG